MVLKREGEMVLLEIKTEKLSNSLNTNDSPSLLVQKQKQMHRHSLPPKFTLRVRNSCDAL